MRSVRLRSDPRCAAVKWPEALLEVSGPAAPSRAALDVIPRRQFWPIIGRSLGRIRAHLPNVAVDGPCIEARPACTGRAITANDTPSRSVGIRAIRLIDGFRQHVATYRLSTADPARTFRKPVACPGRPPRTRHRRPYRRVCQDRVGRSAAPAEPLVVPPRRAGSQLA